MQAKSMLLERVVFWISGGIFFIGFVAGYFYEPAWLNRCGSLIVAFAILVAGFKIGEILREKVEDFKVRNLPMILANMRQEVRDFFDGDLPEGFEGKHREAFERALNRAFDDKVREQVDRLRKVELNLLLFGTIINGFGDWLIHKTKWIVGFVQAVKWVF